VIEVDKALRASWSKAVTNLKRRNFDWILCPHESTRSAFLVWQLTAKHKVGFSRPLNILAFNHRLRRPLELPEALRQLALLEPIDKIWGARLNEFALMQTASGGQSGSGTLSRVPEWASMELTTLKKVRAEFRKLKSVNEMSEGARVVANELSLEKSSRMAVLAPGSVWPTKMWTKLGYAETAQALIAEGWRVIVVGAPNEKVICDEVVTISPQATSIAGRTSLYESAEIIACADLVICNDSGAMHMASAAGVPLVSVFGPTVLEFGYRPWQNAARVVEISKIQLRCRPCGKHGANVCPIGTHECMTRINASVVLDVARDIVKLN
jgi:heptosyltransferase-2